MSRTRLPVAIWLGGWTIILSTDLCDYFLLQRGAGTQQYRQNLAIPVVTLVRVTYLLWAARLLLGKGMPLSAWWLMGVEFVYYVVFMVVDYVAWRVNVVRAFLYPWAGDWGEQEVSTFFCELYGAVFTRTAIQTTLYAVLLTAMVRSRRQRSS